MEKQRYFLHLRYKGTNFFGWQIQPDHPSIQEEIENSLTKIHGNEPVKITGCGRTDTGVHATNYYAHFDSNLIENNEEFTHKLNTMLPVDVSILKLITVQNESHARFDATKRTYHYFIHNEKDPFVEDVSYLFKYDLDVYEMNKACLILKEYSDFECFSKVKTDVTNFECEIFNAIWIKSDKGLVFSISANRFLRNMVRAIVGTMIEIGQNKITLDEFRKIIESKNRSEAGKSAPAKGLFLADIEYPYID